MRENRTATKLHCMACHYYYGCHCHCVTVSLCHCVSVSLCHCVTVSLCHCVTVSTVSLCHCVTVSLCHCVTADKGLSLSHADEIHFLEAELLRVGRELASLGDQVQPGHCRPLAYLLQYPPITLCAHMLSHLHSTECFSPQLT